MEERLAHPKQLIKICGEELAARTIRLLRDHASVEDITIVAADVPMWRDFSKRCGVRLVTQPDPKFVYPHALDFTLPYWAPVPERTLILNGDVVFSPAVIEALAGDLIPIEVRKLYPSDYALATFAVRFVPNIYAGRAMQEMYGFSFSCEFQERLRELLAQKNPPESPYHDLHNGMFWYLMHVLKNEGVAYIHPVGLDDYTDDIDDPSDLESTLPRIEAAICKREERTKIFGYLNNIALCDLPNEMIP